MEVNVRYVAEQGDLLPEQDFAAPPPGYALVGTKLSTSTTLSKNSIRLYVQATNLLNTNYRDYLNRQRYYADDLGRSIVVGANVRF